MGGVVGGELVRRFRELEASHAKLREQLELAFALKERDEDWTGSSDEAEGGENEEMAAMMIPGYFAGNPHRTILRHMGHALHIYCPLTGEIFYWNRSAENLYGWRDYEIVGQTVTDVLIDEKNYSLLEHVMERLNTGQSWSGQFPFRKKTGERFMAMVAKSLLYENGEIIGIITVSSDAALLNDVSSEKSNMYWDEAKRQPRDFKPNLKRINWRPNPQIKSSVATLATKNFPRKHVSDNNEGENFQERCGCILEKENVQTEEPEISASKAVFRLQSGFGAKEGKTFNYEGTISRVSPRFKIAGKVLAKLNIQGKSNHFQESNEGSQINSENLSTCTSVEKAPDSSQAISSHNCNACYGNPNYVSKECLHRSDQVHSQIAKNRSQDLKTAECCASDLSNISWRVVPDRWNNGSGDRMECSDKGLEQTGKKHNAEHKLEDSKEDLSAKATMQNKHSPQKKVENYLSSPSTTSGDTNGSCKSLLVAAGEKEPNSSADTDIRWEDLLLGEAIGEGSFAVVYQGVWNGSDVAVKVYLGQDYQEGLLQDYKKEVSIIKRLRHPNVLLFMGAACSMNRLAIVTEFLPRGSLFRTLHRSNQKLDLKRRLRMALDVARGMNYLHRRSPPIIHRDLKSSNLLVDKNWNVKVGDFGLSCLKISTVMTAKSGRGTVCTFKLTTITAGTKIQGS